MTSENRTADLLADWNGRKLLAELLGTYVLVLGGATAILASINAYGGVDIVLVSFAFGMALLAGLYAFGEVSGGHFNPAVSLAMLLDGRMGVALTLQYWVVQIVGGILAGFTLLAATDKSAVAATATTFGNLKIWEAFTFEALFTAIFVVVILKVVKSATSSNTAFLAIGLTLVAIHLALIPFTGASVNPARSLGSSVPGGVWTDQWVYWTAPLVGAVVGWALHKAVTMDFE